MNHTDQKNSQKIFHETVALFFPSQKSPTFYQITGGINNWTKGLLTSHGDYVVRVYNNGKNFKKVEIEHQVLVWLEKIGKGFKTPELVRLPGSQETIGVLKDGYPCCITKKIQGSLPKQLTKQNLQNFGQSVSELTLLLQSLPLTNSPQTPPYRHLYSTHSSIPSHKKLLQILSSPAYDSVRESTDKLLEYLGMVEEKLGWIEGLGLPEQYIHGDLHCDNVLMKDGVITGILDFQFIAKDWRAMEFAICVSKYVNHPTFPTPLKNFHSGYNKNLQLTIPELQSIPWLIILRLVSNFIYFVGRAASGQDTLSLCYEKIQLYRGRIGKLVGWVDGGGERWYQEEEKEGQEKQKQKEKKE